MTIASSDKEIGELIKQMHIYGAETVINALARAAKNEPYLDKAAVIRLVNNAWDQIEDENKGGEALGI